MLDTNISNQLGPELRNQLIANFTELNRVLGLNDNKTAAEIIEGLTQQIISARDDELRAEIRAIITPDQSPLQITQEVVDFRKDSYGVVHPDMSDRLMNEFKYLVGKYFGNKEFWDQPIVVNVDGSISINYLQTSGLSKLQTIGILGDSVSYGLRSKKNYGQYINAATGVAIQNVAISGAQLSDNSDASIFQQTKRLTKNDLYILQGTDDDWLANVPVGIKNDSEKQSYIGAFYKVIANLKALNPNAKIIVLTTTLQTPMSGNIIRRTDMTKNALGLTLHDYMDAQILACNDLNLPYVNLMRTDLFEPSNPAFRKRYMSEGLHPNENGHQIIAREIAKIYQNFYA